MNDLFFVDVNLISNVEAIAIFFHNLELHQLTKYKPADLKECVRNIHALYLKLTVRNLRP